MSTNKIRMIRAASLVAGCVCLSVALGGCATQSAEQPAAATTAATTSAATSAETATTAASASTTEPVATTTASTASTTDAAAASSGRHVVTPFCEFDIPEYWVGKVDATLVDNECTVTVGNNAEAYLFTISEVPTDDNNINAGDIGNSCLYREKTSSGTTVELWDRNWAFIAATCTDSVQSGRTSTYSFKGLDEATLDNVLDIATVGAVKKVSDMPAYSREYSYPTQSRDVIEQQIIPTIVLK